jgi:adenylate cyclase
MHMAFEIERKFLVTNYLWRNTPGVYFCQGYLSRAKERTVRVRVAGERGFLTIKGSNKGATRAEYDYGIPADDARELLGLCDGPLIEKNRRALEYEGHMWEIDEFLGENAGLIVAEIELDSEDESFIKPDWVGEEVTHDARYYNSNLVTHPYASWKNS